MALSLRAGVSSDVGPFRDVNQDAAFVASWGAGVADGVGGGPAGDLASAAFVHRLVAGRWTAGDAAELATRLHVANGDLGAHVRRDPSLAGMATTFTGIWFGRDGTLLLAHTGDSRGYLLRAGRLMRQTRDDSFVQVLVDQGLVSEMDAMTHPRRNIITASLRGEPSDAVSVTSHEPVEADRWLLCSDGVSDYLPDDAIGEILRDVDGRDDAAEIIVAAALQAGSRDNVTAVVADICKGAPSEGGVVFAGAATQRFREDAEPLAG